jgi:hypothetical protein
MLSKEIKISLKSDKNNVRALYMHTYTFLISRRILLRIRNLSDTRCGENQNEKSFGYKMWRKSK